MRILMTADTVGGVFTHAVDLVRGLHRHGAAVTLVTFGRRLSSAQRAQVADAGVARLQETALALEWMPNPWRDVEAAESLLLDIERDVRPDVIHLNAFSHGCADWRAPVLVAGHSCVFSWWWAVYGHRPPAEWNRYRAAVRAGIAAADAVVAPSATMLAALERWYGPLPPLARVIPNGSGYMGVPAGFAKQPLVLTAGRLWDEAKNVGGLVRASQRPALRGRVLLAGEGTGVSGAPNRLSAGSGASGVRALGRLGPAELAGIRRTAAVYAAPARYEPFGLAILEAARDRCALVLGDIASLHDIWREAAVYVDPADDERLGRTLVDLLADLPGAARLGALARRRAAGFSVDAMALGYRQLYGDLVAAARRVPA